MGRAAPFHSTTDEATKPLPLTVRGNAAPPAVALLGASEEIAGTGLLLLIVKVAALDVPPPGLGLTTVTLAVPALVMSAAGTWAVSLVALT